MTNIIEIKKNIKEREKILEVVMYLNQCAQIVDDGIIPKQKLWNRLFQMYRISHDKLGDWWIEHYRKDHQRIFSSYKRMCLDISQISRDEIDKFDLNNP